MTKATPTDWFIFANDDLTAAIALLERDLYHLTCFHAQQATEKALKAYFVSLGQTPPKTHTLQELAERMNVTFPLIVPFRHHLMVLDRYYIPTRYPDALPGSLPEGLPTRDQAEEAVSIARQLVGLIQTHIGKP